MAYFDHEGSWLVVGSAGGLKSDPQWFRNLRATDRASLQIGEKDQTVAVHVADGPEQDALWAKVTNKAPFFEDYHRKAGRTIPIAVLTPA
jgi:deazaflavin-dependent oxidoreductase (nitroreductase family)